MFKGKFLIFVILVFPMITLFLNVISESNALLWLFLDTIYYYPAFILADSLFSTVGDGLIVPSMSGRIFALLLYGFVIVVFVKIKNIINQ